MAPLWLYFVKCHSSLCISLMGILVFKSWKKQKFSLTNFLWDFNFRLLSMKLILMEMVLTKFFKYGGFWIYFIFRFDRLHRVSYFNVCKFQVRGEDIKNVYNSLMLDHPHKILRYLYISCGIHNNKTTTWYLLVQ